MNKSIIFGIGITLAAMSMSASAFVLPGGAPYPCTAATLGDEYTKYFGESLKVYRCETTGWEWIYACTPEDGCYAP